jgi:hypothetical protein
MRDKFFTYADRVSVYAEGKRAFDEERLRSYNPYAASREFAGLWYHGWDTAERKSKNKRLPKDRHSL